MGFSRQEYWSGLPFPSPGLDGTPVSFISCVAGRVFTPCHEEGTRDKLRWLHFAEAEREAQGLENTQVAGSHPGGPGRPSWSPSACLPTPSIVFLSWEALQALVCVEAQPGLSVDNENFAREGSRGGTEPKSCVQSDLALQQRCQSSEGGGLEGPGSGPPLQHAGVRLLTASSLRPRSQAPSPSSLRPRSPPPPASPPSVPGVQPPAPPPSSPPSGWPVHRSLLSPGCIPLTRKQLLPGLSLPSLKMRLLSCFPGRGECC